MTTDARRLLLHRDLAELQRLALWIEDWDTPDLSADLSFAVQVCLEEAVANIMMYTAAQDAPLNIVVEVERTGQALVARVEDNGSAFDPTLVELFMAPGELGRVIGRQGRTAAAMRTLVSATAELEGARATLEFRDDQ